MVLFLWEGEGKPVEGRMMMREEERDLLMCVVVVGWVVLPELEVEVGIWICPSESWVAGAEIAEEEEEEEEEEEDVTASSGFEMPNWVEYWNLPVASSMIWRP